MSDASPIEWCDATWNPVRGCSRVNPDCDNCYAMKVAYRFSGPGLAYEGLAQLRRGKADWTGVVRMVPAKLRDPLHWREPRRIFVNSQSDLFHQSLSWERQIDDVFGIVAACDWHTFQVLTKRARNMRDYVQDWYRRAQCKALPNLWLGVSAGHQKALDEFAPLLRETPSAVRFLSLEPLLEGLRLDLEGIDWVIAGGESGTGARPCDVEWIGSIVEQCRDAGVACFVKQLGARPVFRTKLERFEVFGENARSYGPDECGDLVVTGGLRHKKGGDPLEWPADLRVREFPAVRHG